MPQLNVPKVSLSEGSGSKFNTSNAGGQSVIGMIGSSELGTPNVLYTITSLTQAQTIFGSNTSNGKNLVKMITKAFQEGANKIVAVTVGPPVLLGTTPVTLTAAFDPVLNAATPATITVSGFATSALVPGSVVYLGTGNTYDKEEKLVVLSASGTTVVFTTNIKYRHEIGEVARGVTGQLAATYDTGIQLLVENEDKNMLVCEDNSPTVAAKFVTAVSDSYTGYGTPCVYICGPVDSDTAGTIATKAVAFNNNRVIIPYPNLVSFVGNTLEGCETAAALAGSIAGNGIPKLNHNFTEFTSVGGLASKILDPDALITAGVCPLMLKYGDILLTRFVTTYTKVGVVPSKTWQEAAVRLNVDYLEKVMSRRLQSRFMQVGNTAEVRAAIKMECISVLDSFATSSVIVADSATGTPAYRDPVVSTNALDDTQVDVTIEVSPGKPLNFITLNFKVIL